MSNRVESHKLKCSCCKDSKNRVDFPKNKNTKTGYGNVCKLCMKSLRDRKKQVTLEEAKAFHAKEEQLGTIYTCKSCTKQATAKSFYFKRDNGKVYIAESVCRECNSFYSKLNVYGVTKAQFLSMLKSQNNCCKICNVSHEEYKSRYNGKCFSIDHCHTSGKIRGLLCEWCNKGLGHFKDDLDLLSKAINYLKDNDIVSTSSES